MMSETQFDARLKQIDDRASGMQDRVDGFRDQQLAKLFIEADWSQARIAKRMGKSHQWVSFRLCFGRFLAFSSTSGRENWSLPTNLTERSFRLFWEGTTSSGNFTGKLANSQAAIKDEERRFAEIIGQMR